MEFQDVIRRRRMVRRYLDRPVPPEVVDRIVGNGLRAPSAGFSQGWGFLVLDDPADIDRFRAAVRPPDDADKWFAANVRAPLLIVPLSNKDVYLDRYAQADKGFVDRSDAWWPAPYWDIDTGFAGSARASSGCRSSGSTRSARPSACRPSSGRSGPSPSGTPTSRPGTCAAAAARPTRWSATAAGARRPLDSEPGLTDYRYSDNR
jgi:hypothetical protein